MSKPVTDKPVIACFGVGDMGQAIAARLLDADHDVHIWSRSSDKAVALMEQGAQLSGSIDENIRVADVILSSLPNALAIQEVLLEVHWAHDLKGRTVIQTGHLNPSRSNALMDAFQAHGAQYVEVPLLGTVDEAKAGQLTALLGGSTAQFQKWHALISVFAKQIHHVGEVGQASALKLAFSQLNAMMMCAFSSSLGLLQSGNVSTEQFMDLLRTRSEYAPLFDQKLDRLLARDYGQPQWPIRNVLQDINLLTETLEDIGINAPFVAGVQDVLYSTLAKGLADVDYSALNEVVFPPRK